MDKVIQYLKKNYIKFKYRRYGWSGSYASWQEANAKCEGYDAGNIIEKVKTATLKVKNNEAVYERDAVLYDKIAYTWPLLANLLWIAGLRGNQLSVLDFGGSLGTTYFQNRGYLKQLKKLSWSIVEQPAFIRIGKKEIAGEELDFFETIEAAIAVKGKPDILLISCVLPYMEQPFELLKNLADKNIPYIIIDSTYFNNMPSNRLTIQKVPPFYYEASYPAWFLNYNEVIDVLSKKYELLAEYTNDEILYLDGEKIPYRGFIMQLKTNT